MKKTLIAMALTVPAASVALAANVQLYGVIETGVVVQKEKHEATKVHMGNAMDLGSRWGIRGSEDLGNGNSVGFILENGFNPNTGATSIGDSDSMFGRESVLYVKNEKIGRFGMGRAGTLFSGLGSWDMQTGYVFKGGYGLIGWPVGYNYSGNFNRVNNALMFQSSYFNGFRFGVMYSNGTGDDSKFKWSRNTHYYGVAFQYNQGALNTSLGFEAQGYTYTDGVRSGAQPKYILNYGIEYKTAAITPMFAYRYMNQDGAYKLHTFGLSALIPAPVGRFKAAVRYTFGKTENANMQALENTDKMTNFAAGVAYEYPLSKRTAIKPFVGYSVSGKSWKNYKPMTSPKYDANAVYNGWQAYVGIHHFF